MQRGYCGLRRDRLFVNYNKLYITNPACSMSIKVTRAPDVTSAVRPDYMLLFFDLLTEKRTVSCAFMTRKWQQCTTFPYPTSQLANQRHERPWERGWSQT